MNAEVDSDDHLSQMARANGKRADDHHIADSHDDRHSIRHLSKQSVGGPVIDNRNQISTPALITLLLAFFIASTVSALAIGMSWHALDTAHTAEREGRLAQERADRLEVDVKVMLATEGKR